MNQMMISRLGRATAALAAMLLLGAALPALAGDGVKKPEFTMTLPAGWVEAPKQAMATFNANVARAMSQLPKNRIPSYQYAFQPESGPHWLSGYSYVVVRVMSDGRVPESELAKFETTDMNKEIHKHEKDLPSALKKMEMGKPLYDPSSHTVWVSANLKRPDGVEIRALTAMIATRDGFLQVTACAPKAEFGSYYAMYRSMIASVVIPPDSRY